MLQEAANLRAGIKEKGRGIEELSNWQLLRCAVDCRAQAPRPIPPGINFPGGGAKHAARGSKFESKNQTERQRNKGAE